MRINIVSFEKTSHSRVTVMEKINAEFIFALNFAQNIILLLLLVFSKEAILFYINHDIPNKCAYKCHIALFHTCNMSSIVNLCEVQTTLDRP